MRLSLLHLLRLLVLLLPLKRIHPQQLLLLLHLLLLLQSRMTMMQLHHLQPLKLQHLGGFPVPFRMRERGCAVRFERIGRRHVSAAETGYAIPHAAWQRDVILRIAASYRWGPKAQRLKQKCHERGIHRGWTESTCDCASGGSAWTRQSYDTVSGLLQQQRGHLLLQ
jgi:hypothetical protein